MSETLAFTMVTVWVVRFVVVGVTGKKERKLTSSGAFAQTGAGTRGSSKSRSGRVRIQLDLRLYSNLSCYSVGLHNEG